MSRNPKHNRIAAQQIARTSRAGLALSIALALSACGGADDALNGGESELGEGGSGSAIDGSTGTDAAGTSGGSGAIDGGSATGGSGGSGGGSFGGSGGGSLGGSGGGSSGSFGPQGCKIVGSGDGTMEVTAGMSFSQIKSVIEAAKAGARIDIAPGVYELKTGSSSAVIAIPSGVTVNGNCAELRVYGADRNAAMTSSTQRLKLTAFGHDITVNSLVLRGRTNVWIGGDDIAMNSVVVDQSNAYTSYADVKYNRLDGFYGCFVIVKSSNRVTYSDCEAWYADHMGFAVWTNPYGEPGTLDSIHYYRCSAMHCGSGWENDGKNPWGRGFDFFETTGTMTNLVAESCYAYDGLQSGFYNEGDYGKPGDAWYHPQSISGVVKNCHAENSGMRIAEASIKGTPLIVGLNGKKYGVPEDVYGEGFYISGDIQLVNNTSRGNLRGFTVSGARIDGFQDEGSYFGGSIAGGSLQRFVSVGAKVYALASYGIIHGSIGILGFDSPGRAPVMFNWFTLARQVNIAPKSYLDLGTNNAAVLLTSGAPANTDSRFNCTNSFSTNVSPSLSIQVDNHAYDTFDTTVDAWCGSPSSSNVTVEYSDSIETLPMPPAYTP